MGVSGPLRALIRDILLDAVRGKASEKDGEVVLARASIKCSVNLGARGGVDLDLAPGWTRGVVGRGFLSGETGEPALSTSTTTGPLPSSGRASTGAKQWGSADLADLDRRPLRAR